MRSNFTSNDIKEFIEDIYNGNLRLAENDPSVPYVNENSEKILLIDDYDGTKEEKDLAKYLNINFYSWKNRVVEANNNNEQSFTAFDSWLESINYSMDKSYGLVELLDQEVTPSQDIDAGTFMGRITFLMQTNKITNLEYYVSKIRNKYLGNPQKLRNADGKILNAYIIMGSLIYDEEPVTMQLGECVIVSCNFTFSYMSEAKTYSDTKIEISFDGDDFYNEKGEIVDADGNPTETKYLSMPLTKVTWQNVIANKAVPSAERPDLTGFLATSISSVKSLSFFDFNILLTNKINDIFWKMSAVKIDGKPTERGKVNIPVYLKITNNGHFYIFKDMIDSMEKVISNNDFDICSLTLKGWGKII